MVRSLVAHGARFEGDEKNDLWSAMRLKMALADEPVDTAQENPLVWRILTMPRGSLFAVFPTEVKLLNKSTTVYGTPLCAALVKDAPDIYPQLLDAGAHLSNEEWRDPAVMASLNRAIAERPDLHWPHPQAK